MLLVQHYDYPDGTPRILKFAVLKGLYPMLPGEDLNQPVGEEEVYQLKARTAFYDIYEEI
jgi:hypothetical protein